jgi:hypothetical protein
MMPRLTIVIAMSLTMAAPAAAQDDFWMNRFNDANQAAVNDSLTRLNTLTVQRAVERQAQQRAQLSRFRGEYGADHPKVRQLEGLCERAGY